MKKVELLAPVGHMEGLRAAVANGADAVYIGGTKFGARREAAFDHEDLVHAIHFAHLYGVRVYVTINITVFDEEMADLIEYIHFLYESGVDAVIVADLGVARIVRELYPDFKIHFSTQMNLHNRTAVRFARRFGASRVVAARENSLTEIKEMAKARIEIEVFVHGALCVSYSGQCLMSSMAGGRSGNRGACAQPCRLPHEVVQIDSGVRASVGDSMGAYQLSPRDLKTVRNIRALVNAGVTSFKIEGRLKSAEYVAATVRAYRHAIDQALEGKKIQIPEQMSADLDQVFNRSFTRGFLLKEGGQHWIGPERPGHRGVLIGKVIAAKNQRATLELSHELHLQDGLRFVGLDHTEFGMMAQKMFVNGDDVKVAHPGLVDLPCPFQPQVGMMVYKTTSAELAKRLNDVPLPSIPIYGSVKLRVGEPFEIVVYDLLMNTVTVTSTESAEMANNQGVGEERLRQQLEKTGDTPFFFDDIAFEVDELATIPISTINGIRRDALDGLATQRMNPYPDRVPSEVKICSPKPLNPLPSPKLAVSVRTLEQLRTICVSEIKIATVYYNDTHTLHEAVRIARAHDITLIPQISRVRDDALIKLVIRKLKKLNIKYVMVGEYGLLEALQGSGIEILTDHSFHTNNVQHAEALRQLNVIRCTASYEIHRDQLRSLVKHSPLPFEVVVFGRIPLMVMKHCPIKMAHGDGDGAGNKSGNGPCLERYCQNTTFGLQNKKGFVLPLLQEGACLTEVYSSEHVILLEQLETLARYGVERFRLSFTNETEVEIVRALHAFSRWWRKMGNLDRRWLDDYKEGNRYTKGRHDKGVE